MKLCSLNSLNRRRYTAYRLCGISRVPEGPQGFKKNLHTYVVQINRYSTRRCPSDRPRLKADMGHRGYQWMFKYVSTKAHAMKITWASTYVGTRDLEFLPICKCSLTVLTSIIFLRAISGEGWPRVFADRALPDFYWCRSLSGGRGSTNCIGTCLGRHMYVGGAGGGDSGK